MVAAPVCMLNHITYRRQAVNGSTPLFQQPQLKPSAGETLQVFPSASEREYIASLNDDGGPSMPEVQSFKPHDAADLVDPFTGDFSYNIQLFDVGGYPVNLSYQSGAGLNDEASWVGLGWTLNPGAVNRHVRGLPDDFKGDQIKKELSAKPMETIGFGGELGLQIFGVETGSVGAEGNLNLGLGIRYNNYNGWDVSASLGPELDASAGSFGLQLGGDLELSSASGADVSGSLSINYSLSEEAGESASAISSGLSLGGGLGFSYNSRRGMEDVYFNGQAIAATRGHVYSGHTRFGLAGNFSLMGAKDIDVPSFTMPKVSSSVTFKGTLGGEINGTHINGEVHGYYNRDNFLQYATRDAYGYLYTHESTNSWNLHDAELEKNLPFQMDRAVLPLTVYAYDLYQVNAQGLSGNFRPFRADQPVLSPARASSTASGTSDGFEIGLGAYAHGGYDYVLNNIQSEENRWEESNAFATALAGTTNDKTLTGERVYFKNVGEGNAMANPQGFERLGGFLPAAVKVENDRTTNQLVDASGQQITTMNSNTSLLRTNPEPRTLPLTYLNAEEANFAAVTREIEDYHPASLHAFGLRRFHPERRIGHRRDSLYRLPHHLSEIRVTQSSGARYIFGLPAYQIVQESVSFNLGELSPNPETNLVTYNPGTDNSVSNQEYYSRQTTPAYAYGFLLTSILSPDYVDIQADGPSPDDYGTYTRFNYSKQEYPFRWRSPMEENQAFFQEQTLSKADDNIGSYTYGEKEVWYLQSIETRNYIALFYTSDRDDALGVRGENGGLELDRRLQKLDSILLYTQADFLARGDQALPIKTVYFSYDYSLCQGMPNTVENRGKLTLRAVAFSHQRSRKETLSPYRFNYANNPEYGHLNADRWGNYKPNFTESEILDNLHFPYAEQGENAANASASAWLLSEIRLPSGGIMRVEYEADDYAYVQDQPATIMAPIAGFSPLASPEIPREAQRPANLGLSLTNPDNLFVFNLPQRRLAPGFPLMRLGASYGNFKINIKNNLKEWVPCFIPARILNQRLTWESGVFPATPAATTSGWIGFPGRGGVVPGYSIHPVRLAAWQKLKYNLPEVGYDTNGKPEGEVDFIEALDQFAGVVDELFREGGTYGLFRDRRLAESIDGGFLRIPAPNGRKFGGGSRVRRLTISDEWGNMLRNPEPGLTFSYGQEYFYTTTTHQGDTISAGVAAYEPLLGGDENALTTPMVNTSEKELHKLAADVDELMTMRPIGEAFYPAPQVGYSRVLVRNITPPEGSNRTSTGFTIQEFYTAKDFPTITRMTPLQAHRRTPDISAPNPFYSNLQNTATTSQGFSIELNNMHGQPKSEKQYQQDGVLISGVEYHYQTGNTGQLDNTVTVYDPATHTTRRALIGVEHETVIYHQEVSASSQATNVQFNIMTFPVVGPAPTVIPVILANFSESLTRYRSITLTKVIQRTGILLEVVAFERGGSLATRHIVYDALTGQPIVSAIENEYGKQYYNTTLPAHWVAEYAGMGPAFQSERNTYAALNISGDGSANIPNGISSGFFPGDEWLLRNTDDLSSMRKAWLSHRDGNTAYWIDESGDFIPGGQYIGRCLRSGRRNQIAASAASFTGVRHPMADGRNIFSAGNPATQQILHSEVQTFSENWQTYYGARPRGLRGGCSCEGTSVGGGKFLTLLSFLFSVQPTGLFDFGRIDITDQNFLPLTSIGLGRPDELYWVGGLSGAGYEASIYESGHRLRCRLRLTPAGETPLSAVLPLRYEEKKDPFSVSRAGFRSPSCGEAPNEALLVRLGYLRRGFANFYLWTDCLVIPDCAYQYNFSQGACQLGVGARINPYLNNARGVWRPAAAYQYVGLRVSNDRPAESGYYENFNSFFQLENGQLNAMRGANWQRAAQNTLVEPHGQTLETQDALGIYSSQLYGYNFNLPVATAVNARYHDITVDGFEDYDFNNYPATATGACELPAHFRISNPGDITEEQSHTGRRSLRVMNETRISRSIASPCTAETAGRPPAPQYNLADCDLIRAFSPTPGEYLISVWVREMMPYDAQTASIEVTANGQSVGRFVPEGPVVEGWREISGVFNMPAANEISVVLRSATGFPTYFDDLRIQPFLAQLESYVYDPVTLRLTAKLDGQNYAIYYEYDNEGLLTRTKKETERGIMTVQEVRTAKPKLSNAGN